MARRTFFLDVDNTLIDIESVKSTLRRHLSRRLGADEAARFWEGYEAIRAETGSVNIPRTLDRLATARSTTPTPMSTAQRAALATVFTDFPYGDYLFPDSLSVIQTLRQHARVAILSDGDPMYQARKIWRSGLLAAVDGAAMVFADKTLHLREAAAFYPADQYVVVDDKATVLQRAREEFGSAVVTVHMNHGPYAGTISEDAAGAIDIQISRIGDLPAVLDRLPKATGGESTEIDPEAS
jgi:FMN phosphatase YigB (HAD superfamily)